MNRFEQFIKLNGIRKQDLAAYLGVTPSYISKLCAGDKPSGRTLELIEANKDWDSSGLVATEDADADLVSAVRSLTEAVKELTETIRNEKAENKFPR